MKLPSRRHLALKKHQNIFLILRFGKFSGGFNNTVVIDASEKKKTKQKQTLLIFTACSLVLIDYII